MIPFYAQNSTLSFCRKKYFYILKQKMADFSIAVTDTLSVAHTQYRDMTHSLAAYSGNVYVAIEVPNDLTLYNNNTSLTSLTVRWNIPARTYEF